MIHSGLRVRCRFLSSTRVKKFIRRGSVWYLLVEGVVVVELKSVEKVLSIHKKQLLTYLRLSNKKLGLLINFNEELLVNGITRISNGLE